MSVASVKQDLLAIHADHESDLDGGYRLATALCEYREQLPPAEASDWDNVVISWVRDRKPRLWGVALECLSRCGEDSVNGALSEVLDRSTGDLEFREYVANTLIRRGVASEAVEVEATRGASSMSPMGFPNLAALVAIKPGLCDTAADIIVQVMASGGRRHIESSIPPFVYAALDGDPRLLISLVDSIRNLDIGAADDVATMFAGYMQKPFVQRRAGTETVERLVAELKVRTLN